ncbi:MAG: hypothetical protein M1140_03140 [Chloroflexi bacterium]|nr:hypothetical protein [Chloroflexota bacterium]
MKIKTNRAPVLTLWAVVVAEHLGYDHDSAMTLGKAVAGLNAQSKGRRLGIFEESQDKSAPNAAPRPAGERVLVPLLGRSITALKIEQGVRALEKGQPIKPESVRKYLAQKFGDHLTDTIDAMEALAGSLPAEQLAEQGFALYERFRPAIPAGKQGWGAAGDLDVDLIYTLAKRAQT